MLRGSSLGIKLFWFVSGFCIHTAFLNWRDKRAAVSGPGGELAAYLPRFFVTRFWRIYPPYLVALALCFIIQYWGQLGELRSYKHLALHVLAIHNYFPAFIFNINYSFWSIAVEWQRYFLFPLLLVLLIKVGPLRAFSLCIGISLLMQITARFTTDAFWLTKNPVFFWFDWLIGAAVAERWRVRQPLFRHHGPLLLVLGSIFIAYFAVPMPPLVKSILQPLVYAIAFEWYLYKPGQLNRWERWLAPMGTISFSIFLLHEPVFRWVLPLAARHFPDLPLPIIILPGFLLVLVPVLLVSRIFYDKVEVTANLLGKQIANRLPTRASAAVNSPPRQLT